MTEPQNRFVPVKSGRIHQLLWDTAAPSTGLTLHFAHANGFNATTYIDLLSPLAPHFRIIASDLRGHGITDLPADPARHRGWSQYARDILRSLEVDGQDSDRDYILMGHSLGAASSLIAAGRNPARIKGLFLMEPVMMPFSMSIPLRLMNLIRQTRVPIPLANAAASRRPHFPDHDSAFTSYKGRGAFKTWPDSFLHHYLEGGLIPDDNPAHHGLKLACDPRWEAENFRTPSPETWAAVRKTRCPVHVLYADHGSTCGHATTVMKAFNRRLTMERLDGTTHFLPMEEPDKVRKALLSFVDTL